MRPERVVSVAAGFGLGTAVIALGVLRACARRIPAIDDPGLALKVPVALALTAALLAVAYEIFRRLVGPGGGDARRYAAGFVGANFAVDWLFLLSAFRGVPWIPCASGEQLEAVASFLPLAYLAMVLVPVASSRFRDVHTTT